MIRDATVDPESLIFSQRFYIEAYRGGRVDRMETYALRLFGALHVESLERSVWELITRQESLRTRITSIDGLSRHTLHEASDSQFRFADLSDPGKSDFEIEELARHYLEDYAERYCDLALEPLFQVRLLRLDERVHVMAISIHHFITDGISRIVLLKQLWQLYAALARRGPSPQSVPTQFSDYRKWQHSEHRAWGEKHRSYWKARLTGASAIEWPCKVRRAEQSGAEFKMVDFRVDESLCVALQDLSRRTRTLGSLGLYATYVAAVSQVCGQEDFIFATTVNGRDRPVDAQVTGYLGHPIYLRMQLTGAETFMDLLTRVSEEYWRTLLHKDFGSVVVEHPELMGRTIVQWFPWQPDELLGVPASSEAINLGVTVEPFTFRQGIGGASTMDSAVVFGRAANAIFGRIFYRPDVVAMETVERLKSSLESAVRRLVTTPTARVNAVAA